MSSLTSFLIRLFAVFSFWKMMSLWNFLLVKLNIDTKSCWKSWMNLLVYTWDTEMEWMNMRIDL